MKKRALITGITGQDGSYLAEYLAKKGYDVYGLLRRTSLDPLMRLEPLMRAHAVKLIYGNLHFPESLKRALEVSRPHEIYNLAAQSDVGISFKVPEETRDIDFLGVKRLVDLAMAQNAKVRIYQASTSEMFGSTEPPQSESSPFNPVSPYARAKREAHEKIVRTYRKKYGLFIASGILFNHESPRRGEHFVTRKITLSLAKIKLGVQESFALGNLDAKRDWGFAGDYVKAMHAMLQQKEARDYVIATGESHSVREFAEAAAKSAGLPITWKGKGLKERGIDKRGRAVITIKPEYYRPQEVNYLLGDSTKAREELGWKPQVSFNELVTMMMDADLDLIKRMSSGR